MIHAFKLIGKVVQGQAPVRALLYETAGKYHRLIKSKYHRFDFERLFIDGKDPWNYQSDSCELRRYSRTLKCTKTRRNSALELGSSVGIFTRILSSEFERVVAIDFSKEAIKTARVQTRERSNITFVEAAVEDLALNETFDAIICAEIFFYIDPDKNSAKVCDVLAKHLAPEGAVILVEGVKNGHWESILNDHFEVIERHVFEEPHRPYKIISYRRKDLAKA